MGAVRKKSILICNIICAVLLLFIVVCQFVPFWSITSPVTDQSSLLGVTGRQYVHEALIESLSTTYGGFTHQDIATQVLVSVVVGAFALFQSLKNMQKSGHGLLGVVISLFGLHLWATVPAYNTIALGNLLYYAYVALLFVSFYLVCNYLIAKLTEEDPEEPEKKKNVITAVLLACAFSLAFVVFGTNVKTTIDKKAEDRKVSDISHTRYVAKLEKDIARKDATIEKLEAEAAEPEVTEPEVTEPNVSEPDVSEPDVSEPDVSEPEVTDPEATEPEATEPEVTEPEVTEPETTEPEVTEPEVTE